MFLIVKEGRERGRAYKLNEGNTIAGRNPTCQIALTEDHAISRQHLLINCKPDGTCTATDLNSTNGTYLNERRMLPNQPSIIEPGITLLLGTTLFELVVQYTPTKRLAMPHPNQSEAFDLEASADDNNETKAI